MKNKSRWNILNFTEYPLHTPDKFELVGEAVRRFRFKSKIWKLPSGGFADRDEVYKMVNDIRKFAGMKSMTREMFDEGEHLRNWLAYNYKYALQEFKYLCYGDW